MSEGTYMGKRSVRTVTNPRNLLITENTLLVEVGPVARLLDERRRETMSVRFVVCKLVVHEVINLISG